MSRFEKMMSTLRARPVPSVNPAKNVGCSEFEVELWSVSRFVIERLVRIVDVHPFPLNKLMLLAGAVCRVRPTHIFEWGTHIGKSARAFYETAKHFGIKCEIHSIDLPDDVSHVEHPANERGRMVRHLESVYLHQGDGLEVALGLWNNAGRPERVLFFIDGDHAEQSVYRELTSIVDTVASPAVLLHDTFYQSPQAQYNVGPHTAIGRVLREHDGKFKRVDSGLGLPGMTLLYAADS